MRNVQRSTNTDEFTIVDDNVDAPEDQLIRLLSDPEVFQQYLESGRQNNMYDQNGLWFGDFFQSAAYQEILHTLPEGSDPFPPILIGLYR